MPANQKSKQTRRDFLKRISAATGGAAFTPALLHKQANARSDQTFQPPLAIGSGFNGQPAVAKAVDLMQDGHDMLDAVISGVNIVEEDPDDMTVGYGGVPNEDGVVQLDAGIMDARTHRSGMVGALEGIVHPSKVARLVMERTDHALLIGDGAKRFARMHGFQQQNLLTEEARKRWLDWKENLSDDDNYFPPDENGNERGSRKIESELQYGTVHCSGLDADRNICALTSTSGLFYKIPGRVGDSPISGAGHYADNAYGAAGSTGRGEANLQNLSAFLIVERMRMGDSPEEACLEACRRIAEHTRVPHLLDENGDPDFNVRFYALNKDGAAGGAELRKSDGTMVVADPSGVHTLDLAYLIE